MVDENVTRVRDSSFAHWVLKPPTPVRVCSRAVWCAPCRAIAPIVEELAGLYAGRLKVVKVNVDDNPQTPARFGVRGIPNLIIVKGGEGKDQIIGAVPKQQLGRAVDTALA